MRSPEFYNIKNYDTFERWASYWYQIKAVLREETQSVLIVGKGNGMVPHYLSHHGLEVKCADIEPSLEPEIVSDVLRLDQHLPAASIDTVCAFQVLEHMPYRNFAKAVQQLTYVARNRVLISLPVSGFPIMLRLRLKRTRFAFARQLPYLTRRKVYPKHSWELKYGKCTIQRVREDISSLLKIEREYHCPDFPYHYFFECRKNP